MRPTIIAIRHFEIDGRAFHHGAEIIPGLLAGETIDRLLDEKRVAEYPERRSLFRLFSTFSGCDEREQLAKGEKVTLTLP